MTESLSPSAPAPAAMIDFRCPQCQKLLRITAAAAGKQAQCPECRASMIVPAPAGAVDGAVGVLPSGGSAAESPPIQKESPPEGGTPTQEPIRETLPLGKLPHVSSAEAMAPT